jgi:hypothetical protein
MNLGVLKLVSFLNDFDKNVRQKISKLDEKLTKLERTVDQVESIKQSRKLKNVSNWHSTERSEQLKNDQQLLSVMLSHHLTHNISDEKGKEGRNLEWYRNS